MEHGYQLTLDSMSRSGVDDLRHDFEGVASKYYYLTTGSDREKLTVMHSFTDSEEFKRELTEAERNRSLVAFMAVTVGETWRLGSHQDISGLFVADVPEKVIQSTVYDSLVLSGAMGWYIDDGRNEMTEFGKNHGMSTLDTYRLLGAIASSYGDETLGASYTKVHGSFMTLQSVGADIHGDFRAIRTTAAAHTVIAPGGDSVGFAPVVSREVILGYHSTELNIMQALLRHLRSTMSSGDYTSRMQKVLSHLSDKEGVGKHLFADFGDDHLESYLTHIPDLKHVRTGSILASFIDSPGANPGVTKLIHGEDGVLFEYYTSRDAEKPHSTVTLPDDEIDEFIIAMARAGQGRTSVHHIRDTITHSLNFEHS